MKSLILIILAVGSVSAAAPYDKFLSSAWGDHKVTLQKTNLETFGDAGGFKPIEAMQLRLSQNEVIEDRKVALRIFTRGPTQLKLMSSLNQGQNRLESLNAQKAVTDALYERYLAAVEYSNAVAAGKVWDQVVSLRKKRFSMLQAAARSSEAKAQDLVRARQDLEAMQTKAGLASSSQRVALAKMKAFDPSFDGTASVDLISVDEMLKVVSSAAPVESSLASQIARETADRQSQALKYDIEKDDRLLQFIDVSYAEDKVFKDNAFGVRLAFNIPGFASSEVNRSEKARQMVKYEVEAREEARKESLAQVTAREALAADAELYKTLDQNDPSTKRMRQIVGRQDPLLALTLDDEGLQRSLHKQEIYARAAQAYFDFLSVTGALASRSRTNFLASSLPEMRQ